MNTDSITRLAEAFSYWAGQGFEKLAKAKKKKLDPKAKVRNRGKCVFPASTTKDHKDRYPINNIDQARSALRYAGKQKSCPWFHGSVAEMKKKVQNAVYRAYPALRKTKERSKKSK